MSALEKKIISELSKQDKPVKYSQFRENFKEPDFVERLCFLISTGDVLVVSWADEKSKYSKEAVQINKVYEQYSGDRGGVSIFDREKLTQYVKDFFSGKEWQSSAVEEVDKEREPFLFDRTKWIKFLETK